MNINEIAKMAGVSRATVSRYFNKGYVSDEKREKIKEVIEKTGYTPSAQAQMLRNKRTKLVGVIIPKINSESISRMIAGVSEIFSETEYQIIMANTFNNEKEELKYLKIFKENQVDGIILIGTIFTEKHKKALKELKVPIVILGQYVKGYTCIYNDDYNAARDVSRLLLGKLSGTGKKVGFIGVTKKDKAAGMARYDGFLEEAKAHNVKEQDILSIEAGFSFEQGYNAMKKLLDGGEDIGGVFCATDTIAMGAMSCAREHGLNIPENIKFTGIGDSTIGHGMFPRLTTVHLFYKTGGREAATLLLEMMNEGNIVEKEIKMSYKVMENQSV